LIRRSRRNKLSLTNFDIIMDDLKRDHVSNTLNSFNGEFLNDRYEILSSSDSE
jgi:hypothetical protein